MYIIIAQRLTIFLLSIFFSLFTTIQEYTIKLLKEIHTSYSLLIIKIIIILIFFTNYYKIYQITIRKQTRFLSNLEKCYRVL